MERKRNEADEKRLGVTVSELRSVFGVGGSSKTQPPLEFVSVLEPSGTLHRVRFGEVSRFKLEDDDYHLISGIDEPKSKSKSKGTVRRVKKRCSTSMSLLPSNLTLRTPPLYDPSLTLTTIKGSERSQSYSLTDDDDGDRGKDVVKIPSVFQDSPEKSVEIVFKSLSLNPLSLRIPPPAPAPAPPTEPEVKNQPPARAAKSVDTFTDDEWEEWDMLPEYNFVLNEAKDI